VQPIPSTSEELSTRTTRNYIGVGANIGLDGDTTLGESAFTIFSKIGLTNRISFRPGVVVSDSAVFLLPITVDFSVGIESSRDFFGERQINFQPYIGVGAAISTTEDSTVGFLLTGGVDVPISPEFTASGNINVGFLDETELGLVLGIGYNF
jgi:outer membrane protein W